MPTALTTGEVSEDALLIWPWAQPCDVCAIAKMTAPGVVGWGGESVLNSDMPDGTPRRLVDIARLIEA